ncbi:hypothetical protein UlMin_015177 [Ulmus minor]
MNPPSTNLNQALNTINGGRVATASAECGNCSSQKPWVLHNVRIRGTHRRLCTACVLLLHPASFCPTCFQFYDSSNTPAPSKRVCCSKCSSFTHSHCAPPNATSSSYLCPRCASPSFSFFDINSAPDRAIDNKLGVILFCAAKIAANSMAKAVIVARAEAERRVREAALAKKRAREAIDNLDRLVHARGDTHVRKGVVEGSAAVFGSANLVQKLKEKNLALPDSHGKEMFNGFGLPKPNAMVVGSPNNGEVKPNNVVQSNGNVDAKEKPESMEVDKVKMEIDVDPAN